MELNREMMELIGELAKLSKEISYTEMYAESLRRTRAKLEEAGSTESTQRFSYRIHDEERKIRALTDKAMNRVHALAELYNAIPPTESKVVQP